MTDGPDPRRVLEDCVRNGKIMQVATNTPRGARMFQVWYAPSFEPDALHFTSNVARNHSQHIADDPRVAGAILGADPGELGQPVQGLVFTGSAAPLPLDRVEEPLSEFLSRWPAATKWVSMELLRNDQTPNRLYEIAVDQWVLHDEINFSGSPRQEIAGR